MEINPANTQDPVQAPLSLQKKSHWILPVVLVLLLLLAAGTFYFFKTPAGSLRGLHILEIGSANTSLNVFGVTGLKTVSFPAEGRVVDFASSATTQAALVVDADGKASVVLGGAAPTVLYRGTGDLASLAVSEDGMTVAVAELDSAREGMESTNIDAWTVHVLSTSGAEIVSTKGYAPHFFTNKGATFLMVTAPGGITILDLATGTEVTETVLDSTTIARTATVSPNGAYLVIPDASVESYTLYGVTSLAPLRFTPLWKLDSTLSHVAWHKETLYGVHTEEQSTLLVFKTDGISTPMLVHTFPSLESFYRITP